MAYLGSKLFILFYVLFSISSALACSVAVDDNYEKNTLIAHGVSYHDLSLTTSSGITISDYQKSFSGGALGGSCPDYLIVEGRVSFNTSPSALKNCSYAVTVKIKSYMGDSIPDGPIEEVSFESPVAACSIRGIKIPRDLPIRIKKPVIINP